MHEYETVDEQADEQATRAANAAADKCSFCGRQGPYLVHIGCWLLCDGCQETY